MSEFNDQELWLTGLVLQSAKLISEDPLLESLVHIGFYEGTTGQFEIFGKKSDFETKAVPLVETKDYRLYAAKLPSGQIGLMKLATTPDANELLRNEIVILQEAQENADRIDQTCLTEEKTTPNYGATFPKIVEIINADGRTGMFLGYNECIESYKRLVPLSVITAEARVDLKTVTWILGKLLKIISFFHDLEEKSWCAINFIEASNVLVATDLHGVFVLDFSKAITLASKEEKMKDIGAAAKLAYQIAGGSEENEPFFDAEIMSEKDHFEYCRFLRKLMGGYVDAETAFEELYQMTDVIWPKVPKTKGTGTKRQFHEFRSYPNLK